MLKCAGRFFYIMSNRIPFQKPYTSAHDLVFKAHFVEDEEEGVVGGLGCVFFLDATECGEVDGFVIVDEAFVVVV